MAASLQVTTLARLKDGVKLEGVTSSITKLDALLGDLIAEVSAQFENYCQTEFLQAERTQVLDIDWPGDRLYLPVKPVSSISEIKVRGSIATAFADVTALDTTFYEFDPKTGGVYFAGNFATIGKRFAQVTYTAGLAVDTATLISSYPDLPAAADLQVAYYTQRLAQQGTEMVTIEGGGARSFTREVNLLAHVKRVLNGYKRWSR